MTHAEHYDLAIVGSGSGNSLITPDIGDWRVAIIEEGTFGGTCLNVGCIPTKMYVYAADVAAAVRGSGRYGVDATLNGVRWQDIRDRVFGRIDPISASGREYRRTAANTTLYGSHAQFSDAHTLTLATGERISADQIVIATGSRATIPDVISGSGAPFCTSNTVMRIDRPPRRLAILGGGYIAAEFAHIFTALGVEVTVLVRGNRLLRHLDGELSRRYTQIACQQWQVRFGVTVAGIEPAAGNNAGGADWGDGMRLTLNDGSSLQADLLLVATGRVPNADQIGAEAAGLNRDSRGHLVVDKYQRTNVDGIWALGDASSPYQLKHVANHEARIVAHNLAHPDDLRASDHRYVPAAVFTHPQIASVGLSEEQASDQGLDYSVSVHEYGATAYGWALEDTTSFCKLIAQKNTGRLLGAHIMGANASILIQPLIQAMSFDLPVTNLARGQYWIHPALTEVVENALLSLNA